MNHATIEMSLEFSRSFFSKAPKKEPDEPSSSQRPREESGSEKKKPDKVEVKKTESKKIETKAKKENEKTPKPRGRKAAKALPDSK